MRRPRRVAATRPDPPADDGGEVDGVAVGPQDDPDHPRLEGVAVAREGDEGAVDHLRRWLLQPQHVDVAHDPHDGVPVVGVGRPRARLQALAQSGALGPVAASEGGAPGNGGCGPGSGSSRLSFSASGGIRGGRSPGFAVSSPLRRRRREVAARLEVFVPLDLPAPAGRRASTRGRASWVRSSHEELEEPSRQAWQPVVKNTGC